jgi:hypothetical protein
MATTNRISIQAIKLSQFQANKLYFTHKGDVQIKTIIQENMWDVLVFFMALVPYQQQKHHRTLQCVSSRSSKQNTVLLKDADRGIKFDVLLNEDAQLHYLHMNSIPI